MPPAGSPVSDPEANAVKRGPGRPKHTAATIERRRQEIIEAAYAVFAESGYHATAVSDIVARLEIGQGTFYRYFDNKRDVLDHVVDHALMKFFTGVVTRDLRVPESREEFREQMTFLGNKLFAGLAEEESQVSRLILMDAGSIDADLLQRSLGMLERVTTITAPMLAEGVRRGFLRPDLDVDAAARALTGCMLSALLTMMRRPMSKKERGRYVDTVVSMICDNAPPR